jgi:hypothetical protein
VIIVLIKYWSLYFDNLRYVYGKEFKIISNAGIRYQTYVTELQNMNCVRHFNIITVCTQGLTFARILIIYWQ